MAGKYLKDKAYDIIRTKIMNCEFAPGSILNEVELIEEIGASRTPIREALNKLEQDNLVIIVPKKCIIVKGITVEDIAEVFDARAIIEPQILLQYGERISTKYLETYDEKCKTVTDLTEMIRLDEGFHEQLFEVCDNRYLKEVLRMIQGMDHRNRVCNSNNERVHEGIVEHISIIEKMLQKDYVTASELLYEHLKIAKNYAMKKYLG